MSISITPPFPLSISLLALSPVVSTGYRVTDSLPALEDLKDCLDRTRQHNELILSLKSQFRARLLIPGAHTKDIIELFISAIKALRDLDPALPTGVSIAAVSEPITEYLRGRRDTIRCVVTMLTEDNENAIFEDRGIGAWPAALHPPAFSLPASAMVASIATQHHNIWRCTTGGGGGGGGADADGGNGTHLMNDDDSSEEEAPTDAEGAADPSPRQRWMPDPPEATSSASRGTDIIAMLVNIYGSKELFVTECQLRCVWN